MTGAWRADPHYLRQARTMFGKMLDYADDLGLHPEDTGHNGEDLSNSPLAFTHFVLISVACDLVRGLG